MTERAHQRLDALEAHERRRWRRNFAAYLIVLAAGAGGLLWQQHLQDHKLRTLLVQGCIKRNLTTVESNRRIAAHQADTRGLIEFIEAAAKARAATGTRADLRTAATYRRIAAMVRTQAVFRRLSPVDCGIYR